MRTDITPAVLAHLRSEQLTTAICWSIAKRDGTYIRGTEHDEDIDIDGTGQAITWALASVTFDDASITFDDLFIPSTTPEFDGLYRAGANISASTVQSGSDLAPDNMDVDGAIPNTVTDVVDVTVADIEGGLLRQAPVTVFFVNWTAPNAGQVIMRRGFLGEIARDSDGMYTTEIRGLLQLLSQVFVETYGERCVVKRFGDERCKLDLAPYTHTGAVTAVTNRKAFSTNLVLDPYPDFRGGAFTFVTGDNAGYLREAKSGADPAEGGFTFWEGWPAEPQVGDTFSVVQACDRTATACKAYNNLVNFRGHGLFIPGIDALSKGPT